MTASPLLFWSFILLAGVLASMVVWLTAVAGRQLGEPVETRRRWTVRTAVVVAAWLGLAWATAATGVLARFDLRPPPLVLLPLGVFSAAALAAWSPYGTRLIAGLPLTVLVGMQGFRVPLELLMHQAAVEGLMPRQMSFAGWNFDILSGIGAIVVAWALHRGYGGRRLVLAWNWMGALLLANVLVIAIVSMPAIAAFGPEALNTWIAFPPFVWLPAVMVLTAIAGHLLVARALTQPAHDD